MTSISLAQLQRELDGALNVAAFKDYGPNGLQVEGKPRVAHLVTGVTASLALIEAAVTVGADAIAVHHGLFWRGQDGRITGWMKKRLSQLLANDISLLAYHLPLDAHPTLGNNAQLARVLGFEIIDESAGGRFGEQSLGFLGRSPYATLGELVQRVEQRLGRPVVFVGDPARVPGVVAWCTGGAQSYFEAAMAAGAGVFITGEVSEPQAHLARETGVAYMACGHHATERYGIQALGAHVAEKFNLRHTFIEIDNPA